MKKLLKITWIIPLIGLSLVLVQCNKDSSDDATYFKVSGTVSLDASTPADGAIISLSTSPNGANVVSRTVSDATGMYSFMGVASGTYYLNATYDPANTNNLKSAGNVTLTGKEEMIEVTSDVSKNIVMEGIVSGGTGMVSLSDGWAFDVTHSYVGFEFPYDAVNALFKGQFATVGIDAFEFDEANPSATVIKAWVDITSVETGAPSGFCGHGRDGITGCIQGTFGLELDPADTVLVYCEDGSENTSFPNTSLSDYDLWGDGSSTYQKQSSVVGTSGVATFEATSVMAYGNGYLAKGDFNFAGYSNEVSLYFSYVEGFEGTDRGGNSVHYSSFYGFFEFAAEADYGIISSHVGDVDVKVVLGIQFNKTL